MEDINKEQAVTPEQNDAGAQNAPPRKAAKRRTIKKILVGVGIAVGVLVIAVVALGGMLLSRLSRPGTPAFAPATPSPTAVVTVAPTPVVTPEPGATPSPTPIPTPSPVPTPLPLSELYPQSLLTSAQQAAIKAQNANTKEFINVLLVGVDRRGTRGDSNADVVMIATIDKKNGRLKLSSMLRDLYVPIPGEEPSRLNAALAKGGISLLKQTINDVLQVQVDNYVLVDFSMFEKIVNKLGGVTVRMTSAEISAANDNIAGLNKQRGADYLWDGFIFAEPGNVKLNGKQALGYARIRHIDSDFVRTNRQFKVLNAIFAKFRSKNVAQQYELLYDLTPMVETDLTNTQIIDCAISALTLNTNGLLHATIPYEGLYKSGRVKGSSVLLFDMPATAWRLHDFIYTDVSAPEEAKLLSGGKSLPPRTPAPTLPLTPAPSGSPDPGASVTPELTFEIPELDETPAG